MCDVNSHCFSINKPLWHNNKQTHSRKFLSFFLFSSRGTAKVKMGIAWCFNIFLWHATICASVSVYKMKWEKNFIPKQQQKVNDKKVTL